MSTDLRNYFENFLDNGGVNDENSTNQMLGPLIYYQSPTTQQQFNVNNQLLDDIDINLDDFTHNMQNLEQIDLYNNIYNDLNNITGENNDDALVGNNNALVNGNNNEERVSVRNGQGSSRQSQQRSRRQSIGNVSNADTIRTQHFDDPPATPRRKNSNSISSHSTIRTQHYNNDHRQESDNDDNNNDDYGNNDDDNDDDGGNNEIDNHATDDDDDDDDDNDDDPLRNIAGDRYDIERKKINLRRAPARGGVGKKKISRSINRRSVQNRAKVLQGICADTSARWSSCKNMIPRYNFKDVSITNFVTPQHICAMDINNVYILDNSTLKSVENYVDAVVRYMVTDNNMNRVGAEALGKFLNACLWILDNRRNTCNGRKSIVKLLAELYGTGDNKRWLEKGIQALVNRYGSEEFREEEIYNRLLTIYNQYIFRPEIYAYVPEKNAGDNVVAEPSERRYAMRLTGQKQTNYDTLTEELRHRN